VKTSQKNEFADEFKKQWKSMWSNRLDDKVRAEGISDKDYSLLFVERGMVIIATRKFKPLDYYEILQQHRLSFGNEIIPPDPSVGGWGKFVRTVLNQEKTSIRRRQAPPTPNRHPTQQLKKGGRGWLHSRM